MAFKIVGFRNTEMALSLSTVILCSFLWNTAERLSSTDNLHRKNMEHLDKTNSENPRIEESQLKLLSTTLKWFHSGKKDVPTEIKDVTDTILIKAEDIVSKLNADMDKYNNLQAPVRARFGNKLKGGEQTAFVAALIKAYEEDQDSAFYDCNFSFEKPSEIIPISLAVKDTESWKRRAKSSEKSDVISEQFAIISRNGLDSASLQSWSYLESQWTFRPTCRLFKSFWEEIVRLRNTASKNNEEYIVDSLSRAFGLHPDDASSTDMVRNKIKVRALYLGLSDGSRMSFPGTKGSNQNIPHYDPKSRTWYKQAHLDNVQPGSCIVTPAYADINSNLMVVRTIACRGKTISEHHLSKNFALGIDIFLDQSEIEINNSLNKIRESLIKSNIDNSDKIKRVARTENVPISFGQDPEGLFPLISHLALQVKNANHNWSTDWLDNPGTYAGLLLAVLISLPTIRATRAVECKRERSLMYGDTLSSDRTWTTEQSLKADLTYRIISLIHKRSKRHQQKITTPLVQMKTASRGRFKLYLKKSSAFSICFFGGLFIIGNPLRTQRLRVNATQNSSDECNIITVTDWLGRDVTPDLVEKDGLAMAAVESAISKPQRSSFKTSKNTMYSRLSLPAHLYSFQAYQKLQKGVDLIKKNRLLVRVTYEDLSNFYGSRSVVVVNRLTDLTSIFSHQFDNYLSMLCNGSSADVTRYIVCGSREEFVAFTQRFPNELERYRDAHKASKCSFCFLLIDRDVGSFTHKAFLEQFIMIETDAVFVIDGIERRERYGSSDSGTKALLSGFMTWRRSDLRYYKAFYGDLISILENHPSKVLNSSGIQIESAKEGQ